MPRRRIRSLTLKEVQARFDQWRRRRRGRSRIPEELWAAAGELAREYGVNSVSRALRLEFNHLKRVAESAGPARRTEKAPVFVELLNPVSYVQPEYTIELDGPDGTLRIHCKGVSATQLAELSRTLWRKGS